MLRLSTSITLMWRELPVLERPAAAAKAGFGAVEIQMLECPPAELARACADAGVMVALLNVGMGDYLAGGPGLSGVPGREEAFRAEFAMTLAAADLLGAERVHLGPSRVPDGISRDACLDALRANVDHALAQGGLPLTIEPMNRAEAPTALVNDTAEGAALVRAEFAGRVGLQFDIYHAAMNGLDPAAALADAWDVTTHIQFSDVPGRKPPGEGSIDFDPVLASIAAATYAGWTGAEYIATRPTLETLGWLPRFQAHGR